MFELPAWCRQLGPVLHSAVAEAHGLKTSLLEAFVEYHAAQQHHREKLGLAPSLGTPLPPTLPLPFPLPQDVMPQSQRHWVQRFVSRQPLHQLSEGIIFTYIYFLYTFLHKSPMYIYV